MADALVLVYKGSAARPLRPRDGSGRTALTFAHPVSETRLVRFQRGPGTRGFRVLGESVTHQSFAGLADAAMHSPFKRDEAGSIPASRTIYSRAPQRFAASPSPIARAVTALALAHPVLCSRGLTHDDVPASREDPGWIPGASSICLRAPQRFTAAPSRKVRASRRSLFAHPVGGWCKG